MTQAPPPNWPSELVENRYRVCDGTYYHANTPPEVVSVLESLRKSQTRVRVHYGHTDPSHPRFGRDWLEEFDVEGTIGRSTGRIKIPLLVPRSLPGGPGLLDHCVVKIRTLDKNPRVLYQHPHYILPSLKIGPARDPGYAKAVYVEGVLHAQFKEPGQAARWVHRMTG